MKFIKNGLSFMDAKQLADDLAIATNNVHSVKRAKTRQVSFSVHEGMVGSLINNAYTARPETLRRNRSK